MKTLRVALAQINSTVGDFDGNRDRILNAISSARGSGADVVVFPELAVTGYPPEDLVLRTDFIRENYRVMEQVIPATTDIACVLGFIERDSQLYNSAAFIYDGRVYGTYRKIFLPNYGVFDEKRYFTPGREVSLFEFGRIQFGINICEDIWYPSGPAASQAVAGAGIILNLNASPYQVGKWRQRERMISTRAADNAVYVVYVNSVGGQDELIFEGGSLLFGPDGSMVARAKFFEEDLLIVDIEPQLPFRIRLHDLRIRELFNRAGEGTAISRHVIPVSKTLRTSPPPAEPAEWHQMSIEEEIYNALVLGVRDYVLKNGFSSVVIGISGGIDSALVSAIACDALGNGNVKGVFMPSSYSSEESREDSRLLSQALGFQLLEIPIDAVNGQYLELLGPIFAGRGEDVTEQNIQARIRGNILMAYSNKFGNLVLATGNKSEMAAGYATLYGDMAGGFAVIKDVSKTMVYRLARYRNGIAPAIPGRILTKAPSAELKENQKDTDTLPPYDVMDPILRGLIEEDRDLEDIVDGGFDEETVNRVARMVQASEYKRRQAPPGIKITARAFGRDRRVPITNRFGNE